MAPTAYLRAFLIGTLLVLLTVATSCSSSEAEGKVVQVGAREAVTMIESGDYVVLDLRSAEAFEAGHVAGAVHLPYAGGAFPDRVEQLDPERDYLVYSRAGDTASKAADAMVAAGIGKVVDAGAFGMLAIAGAPLGQG
jgi:phage shock protein E